MKNLLAVLLAIAITGITLAQPTAKSAADSLFSRAQDLYSLEDMDGSCEYLRLALAASPDPNSSIARACNVALSDFCDNTKPNYYYHRGIAAYNVGQFEKAITVYTSALERFPDHAMLMQFRGNAKVAMQQYEAAIPDYEAAIGNVAGIVEELRSNIKFANEHPDTLARYLLGFKAECYRGLAISHFAVGQPGATLLEIDRALTFAAQVPEMQAEFLHIRGNAHLALGDNEAAMLAFEQCIRIDPNAAIAYANRAVARLGLPQKQKIVQVGLNISGGDRTFSGKWQLPDTKLESNTEEILYLGLSDCNKAVQLMPNAPYPYYVRGQIRRMLGRADACSDLKKAQSLGFVIEADIMQDCR